MVTLTIKKPLTTADFKAQLYIGLIEVGGRLMLPLTEIEWGQRKASVQVTERGEFDRAGIYDRAEGGDPLECCYINQGRIILYPYDQVHITINWPL